MFGNQCHGSLLGQFAFMAVRLIFWDAYAPPPPSFFHVGYDLHIASHDGDIGVLKDILWAFFQAGLHTDPAH